MPPDNGIPSLFPAQTQMDLADEMGKLGYDASGETPGKGWKEYSKYAKENPGKCPTFDDVRKKLSTPDPNTLLGQIEIASTKLENKWKGFAETFKKASFNPDDQEIYASRKQINDDFFKAILDHDIKGKPVDPLVAERMEQLMIKHPDEVGAQNTRVMNNVLADPAKYGLQADSPGYFSKNAGVKFSPNAP